MTQFDTPPVTTTASGAARRVGVEIEFAGFDAWHAAQLLAETLDGGVTALDRHRFTVHTRRSGDLTVELDSDFAHPKTSDWEVFLAPLREMFGDVARAWLPIEVSTAPLPLDRLPEVERLVATLRDAGAVGTGDALAYAFGLQFNPEAPADDPATLHAYLESYLLLEPDLRREIGIDNLRAVLGFVSSFPEDYAATVIGAPAPESLGALIDLYLDHNPTRNRGLDMLPLLAWLDEARVRARTDDVLVKRRPTFHYRLPDCRLDEPGWSVAEEWNRWVRVERLADDAEERARRAAAWQHRRRARQEMSWPERVWHELTE